MAHEIDFTKGFAAFTRRATSQPAWHGLGGVTPADAPLEVWAKNAGIDFDYTKHVVQYAYEKYFPKRFVLARSDTQQPLSIVSDKYKIVQPRDVLEFYRELISDHGFVMETAGSLKDGARVWALANTNMTAAVHGIDHMKGYLLFVTSCDGELSTQVNFVNTRVVCNNTLTIATQHEGGGAIRIPHLADFNPTEVKEQLGLVNGVWMNHVAQISQLADRKITDEEAREWLFKVLGDPTKTLEEQNTTRMAKVYDLFNGKALGAELPTAKNTAWGLVNAVTEFVDYHVGARSAATRLNSAWTGDGAKLKARAFDEAMKLAA
jgi:phage/plasmid-like protein (TIGR03299 family)